MTVEIRERVVEPEVRVKTVPEVLRHAALVIEERGWFGSEATGPDVTGSVCAWLALDVSQPEAIGFHRAYRQFRDFVGCHSVMEWNDDPGRTAAEVTAALRAAADAYESDR